MRLTRTEQPELHAESARLGPAHDGRQAGPVEAGKRAHQDHLRTEGRRAVGDQEHAAWADVGAARGERAPIRKLDDDVDGDLGTLMLTLVPHGCSSSLGSGKVSGARHGGYGVPGRRGVKAGLLSSSQKRQNGEGAASSGGGAPNDSARRERAREWKRHFEGWKLGFVLVSAATLGTALVLPRGTEPVLVPTPAYDARRALQTDTLELERARAAARSSLPHPVRVVGERFRRLNLAMTKQPSATSELERQLGQDVRAEIARGHTEELLALRALQSELFARAVRDFVGERARARAEKKPVAPAQELLELGGDFAARAEGAWFDGDELVLSEPQLRLLFRVRWGLLTGTHRVHPFGPDLNDFRHYYAILLAFPESGRDVIDRSLRQLGYVDALAKIDPAYPSSFARGTISFRLGNFDAAASAFEHHLKSEPDGPFTSLARNHFVLASSLSRRSEP